LVGWAKVLELKILKPYKKKGILVLRVYWFIIWHRFPKSV
jgi:hypothetical protein